MATPWFEPHFPAPELLPPFSAYKQTNKQTNRRQRETQQPINTIKQTEHSNPQLVMMIMLLLMMTTIYQP